MSLHVAASLLELGIVAGGWVLVWRFQFRRSTSEGNSPRVLLPHWRIPLASFVMAALCAGCGMVAAGVAWSYLSDAFPTLLSDPAQAQVVGGLVSYVGIITGIAVGCRFLREETAVEIQQPDAGGNETPASTLGPRRIAVGPAAAATAVITIAVVTPVQFGWETLLTQLHLPTAKQEIVTLFAEAESGTLKLLLVFSAVFAAPVVEELMFRAGLFRFLRGRVPHWLALLLPSLLFASLHVNPKTLEGLITLAPLTAFGIVFSLAYERTGRIAVVMLAHALFNLHTVIFLLLGLTD